MKNLYKILTVIAFIFLLGGLVFLYFNYNNKLNYWGNTWDGQFWLNPMNENLDDLRFSDKENLLIKSISNYDHGYLIEFFKGDTVIKAKLVDQKSAVYFTDTLGNIMPTSYSLLINSVNKSAYVSYYKKLDSEDFIIESIVL